jgi:hypothetical protein
MNRITRTILAMGAVFAALSVPIAADATSAPNGMLTAAEYKQVGTAIAALKKATSGQRANWSRIAAACRDTGSATALLRTQRASCLAATAEFHTVARFPSAQVKCQTAATNTVGATTTSTTTTPGTTTTGTSTTGTTTTGTTTTPTAAQQVVFQTLACLSPDYQAIARGAKTMYATQAAARDAVIARHFTGLCLVTLAGRPSDMANLKRFASSAEHLAADIALLVKVTKGQAPASAVNQTRLYTDSRQFETSFHALATANTPQKLSACPHQ